MTKNWPGELDGYNVQFVILDPDGDSDLVERFQSEPGWVVDFEDGEAIIFARNSVFPISSEISFEGIISGR